MLITTYLNLDMRTGRVVDWRGYEYFGPVSYAKKGSDQAKNAATQSGKVGQTAQDLSASNKATQTSARDTANPFATSLLPNKNGALSPYAQAQYTQQLRQDAQGAQNQRQMANRGLAQLGFNTGPGSYASALNSITNRQGAADTQAYETGMQNTLGQGLAGLNYFQNQQKIYDPNAPLQTATGAYNAQSNAAQVMNQSPTLAGDIMQGIGGLAGAAGSVMTGMGAL